MHFTALAIKTANKNPNSLCALELTIIKNGCIHTQKNWFFRPNEMRVEPVQKRLYEIQLTDVIDAPDFLSLWPEIKPYLTHQIIICHQATFVWSTLCKILDDNHLPYPTCYFACSMMLSKRCYPALSNRKLSTLCTFLGIHYTPATPTQSATACAEVFLKMAKLHRAIDCEEVLRLLGIHFGELSLSQITWPYFNTAHLPVSEIDNTLPRLTLIGKTVCFTGPLETMTRTQAVKKLNEKGAFHTASVTHKTNLVITNVSRPEQLPIEKCTSKLSRALKLINEGYPIRIINETSFLSLLKD